MRDCDCSLGWKGQDGKLYGFANFSRDLWLFVHIDWLIFFKAVVIIELGTSILKSSFLRNSNYVAITYNLHTVYSAICRAFNFKIKLSWIFVSDVDPITKVPFLHLLWLFVLNGKLGQYWTVPGHPKNFLQRSRMPDVEKVNNTWQSYVPS